MPCRPLLAVSAWFLSLVLTMPLPAADVSLIPAPQLGRGGLSGASLVLEPLDLTELSGSFARSHVRASKAGGQAYWDGSRLILNTAGPTIDPIPEFIERELPIRWRLRLNPDEQLREIRLRAEWLAADGRSGGMMVDGQAVPGPPIQLRLTAPWLVDSNERGEIWEGSVFIELPLRDVTCSGQIEGELRIEIEP